MGHTVHNSSVSLHAKHEADVDARDAVLEYFLSNSSKINFASRGSSQIPSQSSVWKQTMSADYEQTISRLLADYERC